MSLKRKILRSYMPMTEYIIVIAIIALSAFIVLGVFSDRIRTIVTGALNRVSDDSKADFLLEETSVHIFKNFNENGLKNQDGEF